MNAFLCAVNLMVNETKMLSHKFQYLHNQVSVAQAIAGDDVVYFYKPAAPCNAVVSLCGSSIATEMIVLSYVDQVRAFICPRVNGTDL
jgi:hypothetical protein